MAFNIPTSTQWVSFLLNNEVFVDIKWSEGLINHQARYYIAKCYWGWLQNGSKLPAATEITAASTTKTNAADPKIKTPVKTNEKLIPLGEYLLLVITASATAKYLSRCD